MQSKNIQQSLYNFDLIFQHATDFVENVLSVHQKYSQLISTVFVGDQAFKGAMDKAMTAVINHRPPKVQSKSPELVRGGTSHANLV